MALPICSTPILYGKEAEDFIHRADDNLHKKMPREEFESILENLKRFTYRIPRVKKTKNNSTKDK